MFTHEVGKNEEKPIGNWAKTQRLGMRYVLQSLKSWPIF
jgi:hypothetical protein